MEDEIIGLLVDHASNYKPLRVELVAGISLRDYGFNYDKKFFHNGEECAMLRGFWPETKEIVRNGILNHFINLGFTPEEAKRLYGFKVPFKMELVAYLATIIDKENLDDFTDAVLNVKYYRNRRDWKKDYPVIKEFPYMSHDKFEHLGVLLCVFWD